MTFVFCCRNAWAHVAVKNSSCNFVCECYSVERGQKRELKVMLYVCRKELPKCKGCNSYFSTSRHFKLSFTKLQNSYYSELVEFCFAAAATNMEEQRVHEACLRPFGVNGAWGSFGALRLCWITMDLRHAWRLVVPPVKGNQPLLRFHYNSV